MYIYVYTHSSNEVAGPRLTPLAMFTTTLVCREAVPRNAARLVGSSSPQSSLFLFFFFSQVILFLPVIFFFGNFFFACIYFFFCGNFSFGGHFFLFSVVIIPCLWGPPPDGSSPLPTVREAYQTPPPRALNPSVQYRRVVRRFSDEGLPLIYPP